MNKKVISAMLAASMAVSLAACGSTATSEATSAEASSAVSSETTSTVASGESAASGSYTGTPIKVGGIGPITGAAATYGNAVKNAEELAVKEINAANGSDVFDWKFEDDEHDAEKSVNAYNSLKDWGMQMLMGTVTSTPCVSVAAKTAEDNMFQLTPSGSSVECVQNDNAFRVCFSDPDQGKKSAQYIGEHKLATKVAVIYDSSDTYSTGIYESFKSEAANQGIKVVAEGAFNADNKTDFSVPLQQAQAAGAELVFLPIYYTEASLIITQANKMGYAPQFFGCDGLDGLIGVENFDQSLAEGVMLLTPFAADAQDDLTQKFVSAYKEQYGETPIQFAADAYDAIYAIKLAAEKENVTPDMSVSDICEAMKKGMTEISLEGLTGTITWTASGEPDKEPKAVKIENGAYTAME